MHRTYQSTSSLPPPVFPCPPYPERVVGPRHKCLPGVGGSGGGSGGSGNLSTTATLKARPGGAQRTDFGAVTGAKGDVSPPPSLRIGRGASGGPEDLRGRSRVGCGSGDPGGASSEHLCVGRAHRVNCVCGCRRKRPCVCVRVEGPGNVCLCRACACVWVCAVPGPNPSLERSPPPPESRRRHRGVRGGRRFGGDGRRWGSCLNTLTNLLAFSLVLTFFLVLDARIPVGV